MMTVRKALTLLETYFEHVLMGKPLRQIAREHNMHASTVMRRIRRIEDMREDSLVDYYIDGNHEEDNMLKQDVEREAIALGHLCKKGAFIVAAPDMTEAIVMRAFSHKQIKLSTLPSAIVAEWAINGYLKQFAEGKVNQYRITETGKEHALQINAAAGYLNRQAEQERAAAVKDQGVDRFEYQQTRRRYSSEPPIAIMYGKQTRKPSSKQWISPRGFAAATRLAEDFAHAQMPSSKPATINWDNIGMKVDSTPMNNFIPKSWFDNGATTRFEEALKAIGADLSDVLLLFICYEHGIETVEKSMEWPARSGKLVLGIALERLAEYYTTIKGDAHCFIE